MLAHGKDQDPEEHDENKRDTALGHALLAPRQSFVASVQGVGEHGLVGPVQVEECFAFEHRRGDGGGVRVRRRDGPPLVPPLLANARGDHRYGEIRDRTGVHGERLVGPGELCLPVLVSVEKSRISRHEVAA